jgi:discoidin domain receptor family protein 2
MQSGEIPDESLSASSSFDVNTVGPKYSRIRTETNGGAWCPKSQIHANSYEYLEINLNNLTVITSVETQGRFGNGLGQEYAEYYILEYKRDDDKNWIRYHNRQSETVKSFLNVKFFVFLF